MKSRSPVLAHLASNFLLWPKIVRVFAIGLLVAGNPVLAADKPPDIRVTHLPATANAGPIVKIAGNIISRYIAYGDIADDTTFDLTGLKSGPWEGHPIATAFSAGDQPVPPKNLRIVGGVIHGTIPLEWNWVLTHAFGGSAFYTVASGRQVVEGARIHNVQDGWRPRETGYFRARSYPNNSSFHMRHCYLTGIRDDAVENDEFMPGEIEDSLFDGVWTFLSEQNEGINGIRNPLIPAFGPNEDPDIRITRSLVRLAMTSANEKGPGTWFKLHGYQTKNHHIRITDSAFAVEHQPRHGWGQVNFPKASSFHGNNFLLWLGEPGRYGGKVPPEVTFLEGPAAREKWHELRNRWLEAHGYEPRSPNDWNPMEAPVAAPKRAASK